MALYGPAEIPRVLLVRPDVRDTGLRIMAKFEARFPGQKLFVPPFGGWRSPDDQSRIYDDSLAGGYRAAPPDGHPYHTKGAGEDYQIVGTVQNPAVDQHDPRYIALGEIIESEGYRAGINFSSGLPDPYHSDTGEPWDVVEAKWEQFSQNVFFWSRSPLPPHSLPVSS